MDVGLNHYTIEVTGTEEKLAALFSLLQPIGIKEVAKTGIVALFRETK